MSKIETDRPGYRGRAKDLNFGENTFVLEPECGHDRWCNTEPIHWNFVFVRLFITMQNTTGQLEVEPVAFE